MLGAFQMFFSNRFLTTKILTESDERSCWMEISIEKIFVTRCLFSKKNRGIVPSFEDGICASNVRFNP